MITEAVTFPAESDSFYTRMFAYFSPDIPRLLPATFTLASSLDRATTTSATCRLAWGRSLGQADSGVRLDLRRRSEVRVRAVVATDDHALPMALHRALRNGSDPTTEVRTFGLDGTELTDWKSSSAAAAAGKDRSICLQVRHGLAEGSGIPPLPDPLRYVD